MRLIEQTRDEKVTMYMKLTKRELVEMLVNANKALEGRPIAWEVVPYTHFNFPPGNIDCENFGINGNTNE